LAVTHQPGRRASRYPTGITDAQWAELDPLLPDPACLAGRGGRWVQLIWADGGYTGTLLGWARNTLALTVEIVKRPDLPHFTVLPRRWVVERTLAWITNHRRSARDYERLRHHHEAMVRWSMIRITVRRLTQPQ
jgi:transposase